MKVPLRTDIAIILLSLASIFPAHSQAQKELVRVSGKVTLERPLVQFIATDCPSRNSLRGVRAPFFLAQDRTIAPPSTWLLASNSKTHSLVAAKVSQKGCFETFRDIPYEGNLIHPPLVATSGVFAIHSKDTEGGLTVSRIDLHTATTRQISLWPSTASKLSGAIVHPSRAMMVALFEDGTWIKQSLTQEESYAYSVIMPAPFPTIDSINWVSDTNGGTRALLIGHMLPASFQIVDLSFPYFEQSHVREVYYRYQGNFLKSFPLLWDRRTTSPVTFLWSPRESSLWRLEERNSNYQNSHALTYVGQLPTSRHWRVVAEGNFLNRGGRESLLGTINSKHFWLVSASLGVALAPSSPRAEHILATGDFTGDGRDDIIALEAESKRIRSYRAELLSAAIGTSVLTNRHPPISIDSTGIFNVELERGDILQVIDTLGRTVTPSGVVKAGIDSTLTFTITHTPWLQKINETEQFSTRHQPKICVGLPNDVGVWGQSVFECPQHHAAFSLDDMKDAGPLGMIDCCPLPAGDMLLDEHVYAFQQDCPDGYVITSTAISRHNPKFRCTKVNTARYTLGPALKGVYWGDGLSSPKEGTRLILQSAPVAMRYAIGRQQLRHWDTDGCIGKDPEAVLTGRSAGACDKLQYKRLLFRGLPGDPPEGTPVPIFPDCIAVVGYQGPSPRCVPRIRD